MRAETRLWRTADGRLVPDGHADAALLAYTPGDEIDAKDRDSVPGVDSDADEQAEPKAAAPSANKARRQGGNK